ncbi:putative ribonuclease H-like domain-containing protein [Tanacetum coccineum]
MNSRLCSKMTMPKMQHNSKFVKNMLPEWGRFVIAVKLNRGLKTYNYDELYVYLKQHEAHANKMMLERYNQHAIDLLALVSNGRQNKGQGNYAKGAVAARKRGVHNRVGNVNPDKMLLMQAQENGVVLDEEQLLFIAGGQTNTFDDDMDEAPVQDLALDVLSWIRRMKELGYAVLGIENAPFNEDNVFQADQCDAFDSDVDEAPTAQTMFMVNLSLADPIYDEAGPSYDSDILSEVQDHDNFIDSVGEYHEYVKDNTVQVVQSNVSSMPNDALMMIINDMHEQSAQCVSANEQNKVVSESLTTELARYKEQVELYKKKGKVLPVQLLLLLEDSLSVYLFVCKNIEAVSLPMVAAAKLLVLNLREFELWKMRIRQYFLMTDYALWEVIVNGDSPPPKRTVDGVEQTYHPTTADEKLARKNKLKARGTLLMALSNEHQLKFNTYKCAKTLMEAIKKRFGGNKESKKTQKTLLKQQYENFNGSSSEGLDQTYDRLQKLISQLEILGETISQEDMNLKFLRSLPSEWKTHTLIWRNKPDLDTLSMDDLYKNLKIYKTEVKRSLSSNQNSQNVAFVSSNNSGSSNQAYGSNSANTDSMSDVIDADDLEEMDLKWQMAMLTMRSRRFLTNTGRKISANGSDTIGFNKSKVECYNCHKKGHFIRECRALRENKNTKPKRRNMIVETTETKALALQVLQARILRLRDNALIELRKKFEKAKKERDDLKLTLEKFENSSKNLSKLLEIQVSDKFKTGVGYDIQVVNSQVVDSQVFDSQVNDKHKTSEGYHTVPPPYTGNFMPPKPNLVLADEEEYVFSESITSVPAVATSEVKTIESKPKSVSEPLIEDWISDSEDENETEFKSKQRKPSFAKVEFVKSNEHVKTPRESVKKVENNKQAKYLSKNSQSPKGNKRNWNNLMTQKLGKARDASNDDFGMRGWQSQGQSLANHKWREIDDRDQID